MMDVSLKGRRMLQGVSLANQAFNRKYFRSLFVWLKDQQIVQLDIFIADATEPINYTAFRQMSLDEAKEAVSFRARTQLLSMIQKLQKDAVVPISVELESESAICSTPPFIETLKYLHDAYRASELFRNDVHDQIRLNLVKRREKHGDAYIEKKLDVLSEYILDELAYFWCYFKQYPDAGEVYPGPSLFVKDNLFRGKYFTEGPLKKLDPVPLFIDVSFLKGE